MGGPLSVRRRGRSLGKEPDASHLDVQGDADPGHLVAVSRTDLRSRGVTRADLDKQPTDVRADVDAVARRYDVTNDVLWMGQDRRWRKAVVEAVGAGPGEGVLDLAAGAGTSSVPFAEAGAVVVPCDFSLGMLQVGKQARPGLPFTAGDAHRLPFADDTFDAVTISFGLRNVVDAAPGCTRCGGSPGRRTAGRVRIRHPTWEPFRTVYLEYLMKALPADRPRGLVLA